MTLQDLIARLESAEGPSRAVLDEEGCTGYRIARVKITEVR